jgi:protocatechuate 3,4-dioxygenase beta subunit
MNLKTTKTTKTMKKVFISGLLVIASVIAFATVKNNAKESNSKTEAKIESTITLSGQVIDLVSGEVLTGVEVKIEELNKKVYTDFDGKYSIQNLKPGEYDIIASYISYDKSYIEKIKLRTNEALDIKLQASR